MKNIETLIEDGGDITLRHLRSKLHSSYAMLARRNVRRSTLCPSQSISHRLIRSRWQRPPTRSTRLDRCPRQGGMTIRLLLGEAWRGARAKLFCRCRLIHCPDVTVRQNQLDGGSMTGQVDVCQRPRGGHPRLACSADFYATRRVG